MRSSSVPRPPPLSYSVFCLNLSHIFTLKFVLARKPNFQTDQNETLISPRSQPPSCCNSPPLLFSLAFTSRWPCAPTIGKQKSYILGHIPLYQDQTQSHHMIINAHHKRPQNISGPNEAVAHHRAEHCQPPPRCRLPLCLPTDQLHRPAGDFNCVSFTKDILWSKENLIVW